MSVQESGERLDVDAVVEMVGGECVEVAARHWVFETRRAADGWGGTELDVIVSPAVGAWMCATADLVEALVDTRGGVAALWDAEELGVDVSPILDRALVSAVGEVTA